jgi:hypothetical protein
MATRNFFTIVSLKKPNDGFASFSICHLLSVCVRLPLGSTTARVIGIFRELALCPSSPTCLSAEYREGSGARLIKVEEAGQEKIRACEATFR